MHKNNIKKVIVPVVILIATFVFSQIIVNNPPKSKRGASSPMAQVSVETLSLTPKRYSVAINSFGKVQPRTQSTLVAQVSGEIKEISDQFRDGGFFEKGDVLVQLDDRDHRAELKISQSNLLSAKQVLMEEKARTKQALIDWQRLGNASKPNDLVLRKPQLAAAQAKVLSAQANLEKAELLLERTKIVAPFAGRILKKYVGLGRVVTNNAQLADIFAIDYVEIRLPIVNKDLNFMILPEQYRNTEKVASGSPVSFTSDLLGKQQWQGQIIRTEGAIDELSQQLYIVAQIDNPYDQLNNEAAPIKIGQYVNAEITGRTLEHALVIPNSAIYQGSYVYVVENVEGQDVLRRKEIEIRWQNSNEAIIESGLSFSEVLVLTPLGQVSSGTPVKVIGKKLKKPRKKDSSSKRTQNRAERKKSSEKSENH